jgi:tetratricopeptide (TPR) repeat protein
VLAFLQGLDAGSSPGEVVDIAARWIQTGEATRAIWVLEAGVERFPEDAPLQLALAQVALLLNNPSRALRASEAVQPDSPQHPDALFMRAQAELSLGRLDRALALYDEAAKQYPDRPASRLAQITTLQKEQRLSDALEAIADARTTMGAVAEDDEQARAVRRWLDLTEVQLLAQTGENERAILSLRTQIKAQPELVQAWRLLLQLLSQQGKHEEAERLILAAVAEAPERYGLYPLAASLHEIAGRPKEADRLLELLLGRAEDTRPYLAVAQLQYERGDVSKALASLDEGIARFPEDADLGIQKFEYLLNANRSGDARAEFEALHPKLKRSDPRWDYLRGRTHLAAGDFTAAREIFEGLVPRLDRAATQYWLGQSLEMAGDIEGARRRYGLAMQRDGRWAGPRAALLNLARQRGAWLEMARHAHALAQLRPNEIEGWLAWAEALVQLEDGVKAEQAARRAAAIDPEAWKPVVLTARAQRIQGQLQSALASLADAQQRHAEPVPEFATERALSLGMTGRLSEGLAAAEMGLEAHPDSAALHRVQASLFYAAGRSELGDTATDRALELQQDDAEALWNRCRFRAATARLAQAKSDCSRVAVLRPENPEVHFVLGVVLASLGETQPAVAAYRRAAELDEGDPLPRNNLAQLLHQSGDLEGALAAAQQAYRLEESNPHVLDTLGILYLERGLTDRAISMLEEAHLAAPESAPIELNLAKAYNAAGRYSDARTLMQSHRKRELESARLQSPLEEADAGPR